MVCLSLKLRSSRDFDQRQKLRRQVAELVRSDKPAADLMEQGRISRYNAASENTTRSSVPTNGSESYCIHRAAIGWVKIFTMVQVKMTSRERSCTVFFAAANAINTSMTRLVINSNGKAGTIIQRQRLWGLLLQRMSTVCSRHSLHDEGVAFSCR